MEIQVRINKSDPFECNCTISNTDLSVANTLRRILIAEVPIMAIDEVYIMNNTGVLIDEMIAHRLGMIPLVSTHADDFLTAIECSCVSGCNKCCVSKMLDVTCRPDQEYRLVTSNDLLPFENPTEEINPTNENIVAVRSVNPVLFPAIAENSESAIVITKLGPGQTLQLLAKARKGVGKQHSKWSATCTTTLHHQPQITIDKTQLGFLDRAKQEAIANSCPTKVFNTGTGQLDIEDLSRCMFCKECVKASQDAGVPNLLEISTDPTVFHLNIESTGCIPAEDLFYKSIEVLRRKLNQVRNPVLEV